MESEGQELGTQASYCDAYDKKPLEDSRELQLQDMLVLQLLPNMSEKLAEVYSDKLSIPGSPNIYPYFVYVERTLLELSLRNLNTSKIPTRMISHQTTKIF
ncbi:hypothetical protein [Cohnella thailandensis]|uniref:hypothetical protein n=1 Tax=Cohnella thailandensis TaxID=557557 RepID=UPI001D2B21C8|nr:hypothetical protein [Cohnella thailandensis]MBP1973072.1 hypothetical protein [Cohnella thailandensis]